MANITTNPRDETQDKELVDVLIAISVVAKRLAENLREEGGKKSEENE